MAHAVTVRDGYVEVVFSGLVDAGSARGAVIDNADAVAQIRRTGLILFDFSMVETFGFDARVLGEAMQRLAAQGVRLAVSASNPEMYGIGRQVAQYSGVETSAIGVFRDQASALAWLLRRPEGDPSLPAT